MIERGAMNTVEFWSLVAYFSQLGAIVWGIWTMKHASDLRDRAHERRHTESMTALRTLIEHGDESRQALRALLERSQERA